MSGASDLYTDWLAIPPGPRPPDHYTLLGLPVGESDEARIHQAADERVKLIKPRCLRYPEQGTQLLNEVARARVTLTDPIERDDYNLTLTGAVSPGTASPARPGSEQRFPLAIHLGVTHCALAAFQNGPTHLLVRDQPRIPGAVAWDDGEFVIGRGAVGLSRSLSPGSVVYPVRDLGIPKIYHLSDQPQTPVELTAQILGLLKRQATDTLGCPFQSATLAIPADFNQAARDDVLQAADLAGLKQVTLVDEPLAAAALGQAHSRTLLVFDMGARSLHCTVIDGSRRRILAHASDHWLGGDDFDDRIIDQVCLALKQQGLHHYRNETIRQKLKTKAEICKLNLLKTSGARFEFSHLCEDKVYAVDVPLTRLTFHTLIADLVERAMAQARAVVTQAGLTVSQIDELILAGGASATPLVRTRLQQVFGKPADLIADPQFIVVLGAALCAGDPALLSR